MATLIPSNAATSYAASSSSSKQNQDAPVAVGQAVEHAVDVPGDLVLFDHAQGIRASRCQLASGLTGRSGQPAPPALFAAAVTHDLVGDAEQPGGYARFATKGGQALAGNREHLVHNVFQIKGRPTQARSPTCHLMHMHPVHVSRVGGGLDHVVLSSDG